ncbi:hypothetical protein J6590_012935 [Homalodisca vitripennis]|nr:hypothetical protein J6590_012935 [Homalodisca vitripennis]
MRVYLFNTYTQTDEKLGIGDSCPYEVSALRQTVIRTAVSAAEAPTPAQGPAHSLLGNDPLRDNAALIEQNANINKRRAKTGNKSWRSLHRTCSFN